MKIRNRFTKSVYISKDLEIPEKSLWNFVDETENLKFGNGWEEVKEESKWHDLRNNPNDLPPKAPEYSWVSNDIIIAVYYKTYDKIVTRSAYYDYYAQKFFLCVSDAPIKKGVVIAWREMPEFMEE